MHLHGKCTVVNSWRYNPYLRATVLGSLLITDWQITSLFFFDSELLCWEGTVQTRVTWAHCRVPICRVYGDNCQLWHSSVPQLCDPGECVDRPICNRIPICTTPLLRLRVTYQCMVGDNGATRECGNDHMHASVTSISCKSRLQGNITEIIN